MYISFMIQSALKGIECKAQQGFAVCFVVRHFCMQLADFANHAAYFLLLLRLQAVPSRSGTSSGKAKAENGVYAPARSRSPSPQLKLNLPLRQDEPVANDHANGYANGHANGHANGIVPPTPSKRSAPKPEPAPSNVKVAIVVRPMLEFEYAARGRDIVSVVDDTTLRLPARCTVRSAEEYQARRKPRLDSAARSAHKNMQRSARRCTVRV